MYSEKVLELFMNPQNVCKMLNPDGEGVVGDPNCGDALTMYVRVEFGIITDINCQVFGGTALVASSSMTTILAKGKPLAEAITITEQDVLEALGGLPRPKQYCSELAVTALRNAIDDYLVRRGLYNVLSEMEDSQNLSSSEK